MGPTWVSESVRVALLSFQLYTSYTPGLSMVSMLALSELAPNPTWGPYTLAPQCNVSWELIRWTTSQFIYLKKSLYSAVSVEYIHWFS